MDNISLHIFRYFVPFAELLAAVVGTIFFYKYKHTYLKYFLLLLWYITLTEFTIWYVSSNNINALLFFDENGVQFNLWFYNLLEIVTFITLYSIYLKAIKTIKYKLWIKIFIISFIILTIINWYILQSFIFEMAELPAIVGSIFLIIIILFYFIELLKSDKIVAFHKILLFWISVGLLLYYSGTIPFSLKFNDYMLFPGIHKLFLINTILAITMYLIFTFGFIWSKKE